MSLFSWLRARFAREKDEVREELEFHLAMRERWNREHGMGEEEARRDARVRFGNPVTWRERLRELEWGTLLPSLWRDLGYGWRTLWRNARFTAVAVFALALGIGINTTIFTAYKGLIKRAVEARDPSSMVSISLVRQSGDRDYQVSYPDYEAFRKQAHTLSAVIAVSHMYEQLIMSDAGGTLEGRKAVSDSISESWGLLPSSMLASKAELASIFMVSENYFQVLGVAPWRGRLFVEGDAKQLASAPAVVISENYWQKRFGGDAGIVGKSIRLNGVAVIVMGIAPHDFVGTTIAVPDFWVPISIEPLIHPGDHSLRDADDENCHMYGRLAPGATLAQAKAEMTTLAQRQFDGHKKHEAKDRPREMMLFPGTPYPRDLPHDLLYGIFLIMAATAMVLVIACANVATLQLARAASRQNELGVRMSLGASRGRLMRQLLTESALLGMIAGVFALLSSWGMLRILAKLAKDALPTDMGVYIVHVDPDMQTFAYVFAISLVAGVLFGVAPALESTRSVLSNSLKANPMIAPRRGRRLRDWLIGAQVAISFVLLIGGSLMVRSAVRALTLDTDYETTHVVNIDLTYPDNAEYDDGRRAAIFRHITERLAATPGVTAITSGRAPDGGGLRGGQVAIDGHESDPHRSRAFSFYTYVDANYFETLGIPMVYGRTFHAQDGEPEPVAVLSETAARRLWPGQNPIGRTLVIGTDTNYHERNDLLPDGRSYQVVGVAHDVRGVLTDNSDAEEIYLPIPQDRRKGFALLVRASTPAGQLMRTIGPTIAAVDGNVVANAISLEDLLRETPPFMTAALLALIAGTIGLLGLVLSAMGIYGTLSYMVVLRTREVGIRMALGARKGEVLVLMLRQSAMPVLLGLCAGAVVATGDSAILHRVIYGIGKLDWVSFVGVAAGFAVIALVASVIPARRAMAVEPAEALRTE